MTSPIEELEELLLEWEAGTLDRAGIERVRQLLRSSEEARAYYVEQQILIAAMKLDADAGLSLAPTGDETLVVRSPEPDRSAESSGRALRVSYWAVAAAAILICGLTGRLLQLEFAPGVAAKGNQDQPQAAQPKEPTSEGIAIVTRIVDVQWAKGQTPLEVGDALSPGPLAIQSGFAQIEFFCGATVVIQGPAELDLRSPLLANVHRGRLRAQVPPAARGFSLQVDEMKVVDLGTEFGLSVTSGGADVQVFDGEVQLQGSQQPERLLKAGEALTRSTDGTYSGAVVDPNQFPNIAALESLDAGQQGKRYDRWRKWSENLRRDPRLITYYAFDQEGGWLRRLGNSLLPGDRELDGAIVGAHRVPGRWQTKGALEFKRPGDRVRVQIPGEYSSLTFACWVKIDSLDRWYNSLFLTDHYNQGEPHWQILDTGQLFFSVRFKPDDVTGPAAKKKTHQTVLSPPFWKPSLSGRWLHLATTYDADAGRTTHYLNGDVLHEESIDKNLVVKTTRIGAATIGNWSIPTRPDAEFAIRNLNGSIDEFAIFAAALAAEEIKEIYDYGKP